MHYLLQSVDFNLILFLETNIARIEAKREERKLTDVEERQLIKCHLLLMLEQNSSHFVKVLESFQEFNSRTQ